MWSGIKMISSGFPGINPVSSNVKIYGLILQQIPDIPDKEWTLGPDDHFLTAVPS